MNKLASLLHTEADHKAIHCRRRSLRMVLGVSRRNGKDCMTTQRLFKAICLCTLLMLGLSACSNSGVPTEDVEAAGNGFVIRNQATGECMVNGGYSGRARLRSCEGGEGPRWRSEIRSSRTVLLADIVVPIALRITGCLDQYLMVSSCGDSVSLNSNWVLLGTTIMNVGRGECLSEFQGSVRLRPCESNDPRQQWSFQ